MLVYVDESGDPGLKIAQGSSSHFVVALVVFQDEDEARVLEQRLVLLRHELDLDPRFEFKFNKCSAEIRTAFLKAVAPYDFFYYGISIRKQGLYGEVGKRPAGPLLCRRARWQLKRFTQTPERERSIHFGII